MDFIPISPIALFFIFILLLHFQLLDHHVEAPRDILSYNFWIMFYGDFYKKVKKKTAKLLGRHAITTSGGARGLQSIFWRIMLQLYKIWNVMELTLSIAIQLHVQLTCIMAGLKR